MTVGTAARVGIMTVQELRVLQRAEPFVSFRITLVNGDTHDVRHPRAMMILREAVVVGVGGDDIPEHVRVPRLTDIAAVEPLGSPPADNR